MGEDRIAQVLKLWDSGLDGRQIARALGFGETTVYRALQTAGKTDEVRARFVQRHKGLSEEQEAKLVLEYEHGAAPSYLAQSYCVSRSGLIKILNRHDVALRPRGGQRKTLSPGEVEEICRRYTAGESQMAIAEALALSQTRVSRVIVTNGLSRGSSRPPRRVNFNGYIAVKISHDHPFAAMTTSLGYVAEHRLVMAQALGRLLTADESVHHVNGVKTDNRLENLQLRQGQHGTGVVMICRSCGSHDVVAVPLA